jgi:RTX calcium-binding nonapeptide repeat (4 copies)
VLSAPGNSTVINPLTTLVQAVIDQGGGTIDAAEAEAQVKTALGLDPALDLLATDLIAEAAAGDLSALDAQKASAIVVAILSAAEDAAGNAAGEQAAVDQLAALISDAAAGSTQLDLTDSAVIEEVLTAAAPDAGDLGSVAESVADSADAIAAAKTLDEISSSQAEAVLTGNELDNVLTGGTRGDTLTGAGGDDELSGNGGNDILLGGDGDDYLVGGDGFDLMYGGLGNDVFAVGGGEGEAGAFGGLSVDVVFDFDRLGDDVLDFGDATLLGSETFGNINAAEKTLHGELDGVDKHALGKQFVTVVFGDSDHDGTADFAVALIGTKKIDANDVIFGIEASDLGFMPTSGLVPLAADTVWP